MSAPLRLDVLGRAIRRSLVADSVQLVWVVPMVVLWFVDPGLREVAIEAEERR